MRERFACEGNIVHEAAVNEVSGQMLKEELFQDAAGFLKAMGDGTRFEILWALDKHELCVCDLANLLDMGAFFSVYAYLGTQLRAANGWGPTLAGLTLACYGIGLALASLNGRLIDRVGTLRSARASLLVLVVVLATLPWLADRPWLMAIGMVAWGLVQGGFFTAITALASDQLPALRGVVTALLSGSTYLGVALYAPAAGTPPARAVHRHSGSARKNHPPGRLPGGPGRNAPDSVAHS